MMNDDEVTVQSILAEAKIADLPLTDAEATEMLAGVRRIKEMVRVARGLIDASTEPAPIFDPSASYGEAAS